jgi:iron complex outermembrane recepter protein
VIGAYGFELREGLNEISAGTYADPIDADSDSESNSVLSSEYRSRSGALYGQLEGDLNAKARWSVGLRGERHTTRYDDMTVYLDAPTTRSNFGPANNLWGGHLSLDFRIADDQHVYGLISRGYKAGGFNLSAGLPADQILFNPESDLNFEVGHKMQADGGRLRIDTSVFYTLRHSEQLLTSEQLDPNDPDSFIFYTGNASSGYNYGLESTVAWSASTRLELGASLGLLRTLYRGFIQDGETLPNRALPHAPEWQAAVNATWRDPRGAFARIDITGMGGFYYDLPPNDTKSSPYGLLNGKLGWDSGRYEIYVWGRNLLDKNYTVRGFFFGDEPPDFPNKLYTQSGEPRNWGVHFSAKY